MSQVRLEDKPCYLVVSNMRSGSSAVARVMHENMGIQMFCHPPKADEFNPQGYYEDIEVSNTNELCMRKKITIPQHMELIGKYIQHMRNLNVVWGLKDGRIGMLAVPYKTMLPTARIIKLYRNEEDIANSMMRKYGYTKKIAIERIFHTYLYINAVWGDNIWASLDMTERRSDEEIENAIRERTREI